MADTAPPQEKRNLVTSARMNVAEGSRRKLELAACQGLPREIMESGVPGYVFERMDFLWRASHIMRVSSPSISRMYSDQLRKLFAEQGPSTGSLSEWISDPICVNCGGVLAPGINCRVRLRRRSRASPGVKKAAKSKRSKALRSELVVTCALCGGVTLRGGVERRRRQQRRRLRQKGNDADDSCGASASSRPSGASGLRGSFIPLMGGTSSASASSGARRNPSSASRGDHVQSSRSSTAVAPTTSRSHQPKDRCRPSSKNGGDCKGEGLLRGKRCLSTEGGSSVSVSGRGRAQEDNGDRVNRGSSFALGGVDGVGGQGRDGEPLSLLERIRKDAKKKRRMERKGERGGE